MDIGIGDLTEILASALRIIDRYREGDLLDVGRNQAQIDLNLLVVAIACTGQVVAHMLHGSARMLQVAIEDKILI